MKGLFAAFAGMDDRQKWEHLIIHKPEGITVMLDNDDTFIQRDDDDLPELFVNFDKYIGHSEGVMILLNALGIKADYV